MMARLLTAAAAALFFAAGCGGGTSRIVCGPGGQVWTTVDTIRRGDSILVITQVDSIACERSGGLPLVIPETRPPDTTAVADTSSAAASSSGCPWSSCIKILDRPPEPNIMAIMRPSLRPVCRLCSRPVERRGSPHWHRALDRAGRVRQRVTGRLVGPCVACLHKISPRSEGVWRA